MSAEDTVIATETGDNFSKEYVERLKVENAAKAEENAKLRASLASHDAKQRNVISKMQPEINEFLGYVKQDNMDYADEMKTILDWGTTCHESASLDTTHSLARTLSCASMSMKRTREEASVQAERASSLSATLKELEELKTSDSVKAARISELEQLCDARQYAAEKLQDELARAGILKDKFDFSKLSSREMINTASAPENVDTCVTHNTNLTATTSNASRRVDDELMSFVTKKASNSIGTHRIGQSGTGHSHLGSTTGNMDAQLAHAIRIA
jgi:hypothetical protein